MSLPFFTQSAALALACAGTLFAQAPAHLTRGLQLADEIQAAQAVGVFNDADHVPLNRYGGSWGSATDASFIRFADFQKLRKAMDPRGVFLNPHLCALFGVDQK